MKKLLTPLVLGLFVLAACSPALPTDGATIPWDQAVELLRSGQVSGVAELHSGDVQLTLDNGAIVHAIGPYSGAIFDEVQACGAPCADVVLAIE